MRTLVVASLALVVAGAGAFLLLVEGRQDRALRQRIMEFGEGKRASAPGVSLTGPQKGIPRDGSPLAVLYRLLGIKAEVKGMNLVPWQAVLVAAVPVGYAAYVLAAYLLGASFALPIALAVAYAFARGAYLWQAERYRAKLYNQIPDVIELLIGAVGAGLPVSGAFGQLAKQTPDPTSTEFGIVIADLAVGRPIEQSLMRIFERTNVAEYAILATTVVIQAEIGGRISESIQNLANVIRERRTIAERAQARSSEAMLSGNVLAVMPLIFGTVMSFIQPGYINVFFTNPGARKLIVVAFLLLGFGVLVMRMMIRWSVKD